MAWRTRKQVRSQPMQNYAEEELQGLLSVFDARMQRLNDEYLRRMGEHIRDIGKLWPSDVHRLQQIRRMNKNLKDLEGEIGRAAGRSAKEIEKVFTAIAQYDARMAARILGVSDTVKVSENLALQRILRAQAKETAGTLLNLSNTTAVSRYYRKAVDEACVAVQSGVEDYNSAIRRVVREAGQHGLRVTDEGTQKVDYESGHSRRLDTAAKMNVLDGVRHMNQSIMEEIGRQFGADGVEIDAHMLCAEDHLPYQGGQYSNEEFEQIQDSLMRPFGEWNCRHTWHGIIMGVSPPTYTAEQLEEMQRFSTEEITIDGKTHTRYEWSQVMRRCEVRVRQMKDCANLARVTGDTALQQHCQGQIVELNKYYKKLAGKVGLGPEFSRTYVPIVPGMKDISEHERERLKSSYPNTVSLKALDAPGYVEKFNGITKSESVNKSIYECAVKALKHRNGTTGEDLYLINGKTGNVLYANTTSTAAQAVKYDAETLRAIKQAHEDGIPIVALHNHPNGMPPSLDDGSSAFSHSYDLGVVAGHNLEVYTYGKTDRMYTEDQCAFLHEKLVAVAQFEFDFDEEMWYTGLKKFGMEVTRR